MKWIHRSQTMGIAALILGFGVLVSRLLGLVRDKVISYYFGTSIEADIYFMAFTVPDFLNYLLAGGYFSITLIPLLAKSFLDNEQDGWRFFSSAVCWAFLAITSVTAIVWLCAPTIAQWLAPHFDIESQNRLAYFLRIILPAQICFLPGACFTALLYYRKQFNVPALIPIVYNSSIICFGLLGNHLFPGRGMEGFCWGVTIGAALGSFSLPAFAAWKGGMCFRLNLFHPRMKTLFFLALPLMLGQSIVVLDEQFIRIFGGLTGEGNISLLNYARRIMLVPVGVVAQAAGLASFPFLAAAAAQKQYDIFNSHMNNALTSTLKLAIPLSCWMIIASTPIMRFIFQQGSFSSEAAHSSGILLAIMVAGIAFWSIQQILGRGFYAWQDMVTPALTGTLATLAMLPVYWLCAKFWGVIGVAIASSCAVAAYTLLLSWRWECKFGKSGLAGIGNTVALLCLFCFPAGGIAYGSLVLLANLVNAITVTGAFLQVLASGCVFTAIYLPLILFLKPDLAQPITQTYSAIRKKNSWLTSKK